MKRSDLILPDDFHTAAGKLQTVIESLDGLLAGTEAARLRDDWIEMLAALTSSLIVVHQTLITLLEEDMSAGL